MKIFEVTYFRQRIRMVHTFIHAFPPHTSTTCWDYMITSEFALPVHVSVNDDKVLLGRPRTSSYLQGSQDCSFPFRL